jgi:4'-phosphopantetheinyl transferase
VTDISLITSKLTNMESRLLLTYPLDQGLCLFFWIWTLKEAYTKALGLGLSFDFARIEYNVHEDVVLVDGKVPKGWHFTKFELFDGDDRYQGVTAELVGGERTEIVTAEPNWLVRYSAEDLVEAAIHELV